MPFWRAYYHIVWGTHDREPYITPHMEPRLYRYIVRKASELGVVVYAINGWTEHVHVLVSIPPKHSVSDVVKTLKGASSHDMGVSGFPLQWQRGYGALTCGEKQLPVAQAYIEAQKTHHSDNSLIKMLEYCSEVDEGPAIAGLHIDRVAPVVKEADVDYDVLGTSPF
jgi:putative transposase